MNQERTQAYYELFERLIDEISVAGNFDREVHKKVIGDICAFFHLAKGETEFYKSLSHEKMGMGEVFCDFDNGKGDKVLIHKRVVSTTSAVVIGTIYVESDAEPLPEDEVEKVDLMFRALLSFVSRRRLQNAVEQLGYYDEKGFPNLRSFCRYLDRLIIDGIQERYTAVHYNLRHFGLINRDIGRDNGDKVMWNHYSKLKNMMEGKGILCRLGGDSFLAVFENELSDSVIEVLRGTQVSYDTVNEKSVIVSACVGVYPIQPEFAPKNSAEIMDKLMPASVAAKREENGFVVYFSDKLIHQKDKQMELQRLFPLALENREFHVFYQPKVDVRTGEIVGAEALCRWIRDGKIIPPMEFIPVLEQNTDICQLDFYMLEMVCRDIRRWLDEGRNAVRVSVNFSRKHMVDPDLLEHILRIVEETHVPHEYVEIELTETTTDVEFKDLKRVASGLRQEGIHTSVDDFGMGYSSLNLIREIPWDVLKIDKSFLPVDGDALDSTTRVMFRHVAAMARDLGLECITEGVETEKQVELLREAGCDIAQGYYYDKPLPRELFEEKMNQPIYPLPNQQ